MCINATYCLRKSRWAHINVKLHFLNLPSNQMRRWLNYGGVIGFFFVSIHVYVFQIRYLLKWWSSYALFNHSCPLKVVLRKNIKIHLNNFLLCLLQEQKMRKTVLGTVGLSEQHDRNNVVSLNQVQLQRDSILTIGMDIYNQKFWSCRTFFLSQGQLLWNCNDLRVTKVCRVKIQITILVPGGQNL